MLRISPYPTEQYSFTGYSYDAAREIAAPPAAAIAVGLIGIAVVAGNVAVAL